MYRNIAEAIKEIWEELRSPINERSVSLDEIIDKLEVKIGERPSKSTVKRIMNQMNIYAVDNKKRTWVWQHNKPNGVK